MKHVDALTRRRRRRIKLWGTIAGLLLSGLALYRGGPHAAGVARDLRDRVVRHDYFSVREIKVRGGGKVGGSEVVALARLSHGMSMWSIDPQAIEGKVRNHPWVKRVVVRREFPHRVVIEVEERVPKGILVLEKLFYVDSEGRIFKEVGKGEDLNLPFITGLEQEDVISRTRFNRLKIREGLELAERLRKNSLALSEVHFSASGGVVLYPMDYPVALQMGWGDWEGKLERFRRVMAEWRGREGRLIALDLSFRDHVVVRLRKG